ncbi:cupin domain-containing protein [Thermomonospora catenispora]|uniref:cupin domain-containing protein n=1 Tax=Thermomonospora catenispora TaxID=2493090 RepID=UPI00112408EF|nr:cupin domain-containing protein [Thermomonospora catenispora]TNY36875.1 cupin domain-containing protein [Thermomonospora catenispora]
MSARLTAVGLIACAALVLAPGTAAATPSSGVQTRTLAQRTVGGTEYVLQEITIAPGGSTGWHYHDGRLYAVVESGTLTRTLADCTTTMAHSRGDVIVEPSGPDHVHIGRNLGTTPVVLKALYVNPVGKPLSQDVPAPDCADR